MGGTFSWFEPQAWLTKIANFTRKRKFEEIEDENLNDSENSFRVPKRRKLTSTSKYIFKILFEEGRDSDVTVMALGQLWHLHKVYLCQSPYFQSMFSGNWKETNESLIHIQITDENISVESFRLALGSLYRDDIPSPSLSPSLTPSTTPDIPHVTSLLAASVLLQLDDLTDFCADIMTQNVHIETVLDYYECSLRYGVVTVKEKCQRWLALNLTTKVFESPSLLSLIPPSLMEEVLQSKNIVVIVTEFSIYILLKSWLYLLILAEENYEEGVVVVEKSGKAAEFYLEAHNFFRKRVKEDPDAVPFLLTAPALPYVAAFRHLRVGALLCHSGDAKMVWGDRLLPTDWMTQSAVKNWAAMVDLDQRRDAGPLDLSDAVFEKACIRSGRSLPSSSKLIWRWRGFLFGFDLVLSLDNYNVKILHSRTAATIEGADVPRRIMYRLSAFSLDNRGRQTYCTDSGVKSVCLRRNREIIALNLDEACVTFPLLLSARFLLFTPEEEKTARANRRLST